MRAFILSAGLLLPTIAFAGVTSENLPPHPSLKMLLFIIGSVTSVLFIRGQQNAGYHTGTTSVIQSVVISICFIWSHYILLVVDQQSVWDFYSNFILNINTAFVGFLCVIFLNIGFVAVLFKTINVVLAKMKKMRA